MKPYLLHREAERELDAAMAYYERQRRGLGLELLAEVEYAAELIRRFPDAWPVHGQSGHRKLPLVRFPFALYYLEHADVIWINAVAHAKLLALLLERPGDRFVTVTDGLKAFPEQSGCRWAIACRCSSRRGRRRASARPRTKRSPHPAPMTK